MEATPGGDRHCVRCLAHQDLGPLPVARVAPWHHREQGLRVRMLGVPHDGRRGPFLHDATEVHDGRSEEHTSELQSHVNLVCRLLLEKKNTTYRRPVL